MREQRAGEKFSCKYEQISSCVAAEKRPSGASANGPGYESSKAARFVHGHQSPRGRDNNPEVD